MTREEAKNLLPIIQAFAEGKVIEIFDDEIGWVKKENPKFNLNPDFYRIKPNPKYRPFETQEECLEEMHKHSDFGWVKCKDSKSQYHICAVSQGYISVLDADPSFFESFGRYEFLDGTPFGIKEE